MIDHTFPQWLRENWLRVSIMTATILLVTLMLVIGMGLHFHSAETVDRQAIHLERIDAAASKAQEEALKGRQEAEKTRQELRKLETLIRGRDQW